METLGNYTGGTFDVPVVLGASPDTSPVRYFKGKLTNVSIVLTDPEYYTVHFDANGGTSGTMPDQLIRKDENLSLSANAFEKDDSLFEYWNTEPDGSGTSYRDMQEVVNLADPNETITLYAQWQAPFPYTVSFNANGGTGTVPTQNFIYGESQNLNTNTFIKTDRFFVRWNTKADGSGIDYEDGELVKNMTKTANDNVILYAIWAETYYNHSAETVFTGSNCEDTNISLYSTANVGKDYEISFEIVSNGSNPNQATLMNAMYEVTPWPGILFRYANSSNFEIDMNGGSGSLKKNYAITSTNKMTIRRKNGIIYMKVNDGEFTTGKDHSSITTFDTPVTFGCSLTSANAPQRYYKGTLKNMKVIIFE